MNFPRFVRPLALPLAVAALLTGAPAAPTLAAVEATASAPALSADRARMNRRVFDQVWNEVRRDYYDPRLHGVDWNAARRTYRPQALAATDDRALYGVLNRMLDLLDDHHAGALSPAATRRQDRLRDRRAVLGVTLFPDGDLHDRYVVEKVRPGSPADEAGIQPGWRLDVARSDGWSPEEDLSAGRSVTLGLIDDSAVERPVRLTPREMEPQPAFVADTTRPGVVVLRVEGFEQGLGQWMGAQLEGLPADVGVVVDLRSNPGGRVAEADAVLSCFLPPDSAWAVRTARSGRRAELRTEGGCGSLSRPVANPVAVLVNGQSRSAAELTPAALQEARRAVIVGETTAGAVLISQETPLPDGGRLTLSRADFVTTGGVRLEKRGVTPDVTAATTYADRRAGRDPALDAALASLSRAGALARAAAASL